MKNVKKITAMLLSLSVASTVITTGFAAVESTKYNKTYIENFDDAETVLGDSGIIEYGQNATAKNVTLVDSAQGGKYLQISSGSGEDVQVKTKKGIFKHDITVVDFYMNASSVSPFPSIKLVCNSTKLGSNQANGIITYTGNLNWRAYNLNDPSKYITYNAGNAWVPVRIILDSINKTVTTNIYGSQKSMVTTLDSSWDMKNTYLNFQAALGSTMMIDDIVVSDGTYMENIYMDYDFEHSSSINKEEGNNFFYGIKKNSTGNPKVVYDSEADNTYFDITNVAGNTVYTSDKIDTTATPVVVEFRMKAKEASDSYVQLYKSSSTKTPLFKKGEIVEDGTFHKYRATISPLETGYKVVRLIDDVYDVNTGILSASTGSYSGNTLRVDFVVGAESTDIAIDDLKIYYPQSAKVTCALDGKTDVATDSIIELVSNTSINASSANKVTITANGETVNYTTSSNGDKNSYIFNITGGLQPNTEYVITTGASGLKDMFDQFYNTEIKFTTAAPVALSYDIDGNAVTDGKLVSGTMNFEIELKSGTAAVGYVAQYDAQDRLIKASCAEVTDEEDSNIKTGSIQITDDVEKVKFLIWDNNQKPLQGVTELKR